jgi:hypothetical protein
MHKTGIEDNISFYGASKKLRNDLVLNIIWQRDFDK